MALAAGGLSQGDRAPSFKIASDGGEVLSSSRLKGTPYIIYFYPKDDTSGCTKEAIGFSESLKKFEALGVAVIGVSKDSAASHDKFKAKYKLKVVLASDPETQTALSYRVWVKKSMYGRSYMGMERATFLVDARGVIREIWRKVKVPGHVDAVLSAAKALK